MLECLDINEDLNLNYNSIRSISIHPESITNLTIIWKDEKEAPLVITTKDRDLLFLKLYKRIQTVTQGSLVKHGLFYEWPSGQPFQLGLRAPHLLQIGIKTIDLSHSSVNIYLGRKHPKLVRENTTQQDDSVLFSLVIIPPTIEHSKNSYLSIEEIFHLRAITPKTRADWLQELHIFLLPHLKVWKQ